jgi:putative CocE/NonD family hydrolase
MVPMRDGVRLAADIYRVDDSQPSPVLLSRTPYNKENINSEIMRFVKAGYVVVIQDVRGRYASEGEFVPHAQETDDGVDMFAWVAAQSWSNGIVGTFGGSYLGGTQWLPAREDPPALRAMVPEVTFSDMYEGCAYQGGAKVLHDLRWTVANIIPDAIQRRKARGEKIPEDITLPDVNSALNALPIAGHPAIKDFGAFYYEWLNHPTEGPYWQSMSPNAGYKKIKAPALNISGWYDIFIWGTLQNYQNMRLLGSTEHVRRNQRLIIGPWTHMNFTGDFPEQNFGDDAGSAAIDLTGIKLRWYDRWLKGIDNGIDREPPVMIFVMGINRWRTEKNWPLPNTHHRPYYLHSKGKANTLEGDGLLSDKMPNNQPADVFTYDPINPVPTVGGQVLLPGANSMGPRDQSEVEKREDVLVYSTPILGKAVEVTGYIELRLFVSSSTPDTDFTAKLVDVYPDGRAMILTEGILRARYHRSFETPDLLEPGKIYELDYGGPTCQDQKEKKIR